MSQHKRRATNELNHDNWDQDDDEPEIMEESRPAPQEVLERRVIKTAKRRNPGGQAKLNVFSSFGSYNKPAPSSFDFLANLTKPSLAESKPSNGFGPMTSTNSTSLSSTSMFGNGMGGTSLFSKKPEEPDKNIGKSSNEGFFKSDNSKPMFNAGSNIFGGSSLLTKTIQNDSFTKVTQNESFNVNNIAKENNSTGFHFKPTTPENSIIMKNSPEITNVAKENKNVGFQFKPTTQSENGNLMKQSTEVSNVAMENKGIGFQLKPTTKSENSNLLKNSTEVTNVAKENKNVGFQFKPTTQSENTNLLKNSTEVSNVAKENKNVGFQFKPTTQSENTNLLKNSTEVSNVAKENNSVGYQFKPTTQSENTNLLKNSTEVSNSPVNKKQPDEPKPEVDKEKEQREIKFYTKLQCLNESVLDWIQKHVTESPICILTPIFRDYERYLKEIQSILEPSKNDMDQSSTSETVRYSSNKFESNTSSKPFGIKTAGNSTSLTTSPSNNSTSPALQAKSSFLCSTPSKPFALESNADLGKQSSNFSFGIKPAGSSTSLTTSPPNNSTSPALQTKSSFLSSTPSKPFALDSNSDLGKQSSKFSFGIKPAGSSTSLTTSPSNNTSSASPASLFSLPPSTSNQTNAPFSFGTGKPFSFSANTVEKKTDDDEEDEEKIEPPPDVKHDENSVYDKKCKVFVKKDSTFADKGVGMLYIKPLENKKNQLLVRANTTVGHILLNLILSDSIPVQRMGKNNVMLMCIPTPDSKPPPVPVLVRVKTAEEADELLEALKKYQT